MNETKAFKDLSDTDHSVEADSSSDSESDSSSDTEEDEGRDQEDRLSSKVITNPIEQNAPELPKILEMIRFLITCLYKMPIRRPAALERLKSRLSDDFTAYQRFDVLFVRDLHPDLDMAIATRLGRLISLRRQIIEYREEHNERMQTTIATQEQSSGSVTKATVQNLSTAELEQAVDATVSRVKNSKTSLPSKATTHRNTLDHPEFKDFVYPPSVILSETSRASSNAVEAIKLGIPRKPKDSNGMSLTHLICPYCSIAVTLKSEKMWKKHVIADLRPYVCSFSGCTLQDHFFRNRKEWYQHEIQEHRLVWHCNTEGHSQYRAEGDFLNHMSHDHDVTFLPDQVASVAPMFRCPDRNPEGDCNICFQHSKNLRSHVARHLQRIALFALPRWYNEEDNSQLSKGRGSRKALSSGDERDAAPDTDQEKDDISVSDSSSSATVRDDNTHTLEDDDDDVPIEIEESPIPDSEEISWESITEMFSQVQLASSEDERSEFNVRLDLSLGPTKEEEEIAKEFSSNWRPSGYTSQIAFLQLVQDARLDAFEFCIQRIAQVTVTQPTGDEPDARNGRILYLQGRPGWGKTTLIKHMSRVNTLRRAASLQYSDESSRNFSEVQLVVAAYYFDNNINVYRGFLESLLHQILQQCPALLSRIGYSREHGMRDVRYEDAVSQALKMLQDAAVWILLDGIDEVLSGATLPVLRLLEKLRSGMPNLTICVTGTEEVSVSLREVYHETIELVDRAVDLRNFMTENNKTGITVNRPSQVASIIDWADGLFLPVRILFDLVQTQSSSTTLQTLPRSIRRPNEFFEDILQSFSHEAQEKAARIILLMLGVERPRFLTLAARYLGRKDDVRLVHSYRLLNMDEHIATDSMREFCPFVHIFHGDEHLEARFIHAEIPRYLKSTTGKALLQSCVSRDDDTEYHYHVDLCEALLAEIAVQPTIQKEALSDFAYWMRELDNKPRLNLQRWNLLNNLRDTLEPKQVPEEPNVLNPTHPEFWRYFPVRNSLLGLVREHTTKLANLELLAWLLGITSHENRISREYVRTDMVVALLEGGLDVNAVKGGTERSSVWHAYLLAARKGEEHVDQSFQTVQAMIRYGAQFEGHIDGEEPNEKVEIRSIIRHIFRGRDELRDDQPRGSTRFLVLETVAKERGELQAVPTRRPDPGAVQPRDGG